MAKSPRTHLALLRFRLAGFRYRPLPLAWFSDRIRAGQPFSFARYGDGEWNAIVGTAGENCDGHSFFPELGSDLAEALRHPGRYVYGMQPFALKTMGRKIIDWCRRERIDVPWCDADVFHDANKEGRLLPLVSALRGVPVILVGPDHLQVVPDRLFPCQSFLRIPARQCYLEKERILAEVSEALARATRPTVVALSASMLANVIVHELHPRFGDRHWLLDLGSLWDVYAGVRSRGVYEDRDWTSLMARNTGG